MLHSEREGTQRAGGISRRLHGIGHLNYRKKRAGSRIKDSARLLSRRFIMTRIPIVTDSNSMRLAQSNHGPPGLEPTVALPNRASYPPCALSNTRK